MGQRSDDRDEPGGAKDPAVYRNKRTALEFFHYLAAAGPSGAVGEAPSMNSQPSRNPAKGNRLPASLPQAGACPE